MPAMGNASGQFEDHVVIVGVGLIGGSIAAAIRQRYPKCTILGIGRTQSRLQKALDAGLLTDWATELTEQALQRRCVVVVCLPVNLVADSVVSIARTAGTDVVITDAGSVKSSICETVSSDRCAAGRFVGAHPIAGGEHGGFEHAEADLFVDRTCVLTKCAKTPASGNDIFDRAQRFWEGIGCRVLTMSPGDHDRVLALTSHLPHVMAAVTTAAAGEANLGLTGSGFRDTTRIAAGDASLWKEILMGNRSRVIDAISAAEQLLAEYRTALESGNAQQIENLLKTAANCRRQLDRTGPPDHG